MKGKGTESDTDSDHSGTTTASGSILRGGKMSASSVSMGNSWSGNGRPGWEGEEIVNVLRQDGIQGELGIDELGAGIMGLVKEREADFGGTPIRPCEATQELEVGERHILSLLVGGSNHLP
jgi:hypothetical protein